MSEREGQNDPAALFEQGEVAEVSEIAERVVTEQAEPVVVDPVLLGSRAIARAALGEITDPHTIGGDAGHDVHDAQTVTMYFDCTMPGYPGWRWAAALAKIGADAPVTVLEVELLPGEGAMLAPEWVPWSERLAQYREGQSRQGADEAIEASDAAEELADLDDADSDDDLMDNDFSDFDDELDGVDIDDLDEDSDESDEGHRGNDVSDREDSEEE